ALPIFGGFGFAGDFTQLALPQVEETGDDGRGPFLPPRRPGLSISTTHLILDLPQRTHGDDRIRRDLRDPGNVQVVELSPQMRPAPGKLDRVIAASLGARLSKARIGGISVDLKDTVEPGEMTCHALAASAVLEAIGHHRRAGSAIGPIIACVSPEPGLHGLPGAGYKGGQGRFVGKDPFALLDPLQDIIGAYLKLEPQM